MHCCKIIGGTLFWTLWAFLQMSGLSALWPLSSVLRSEFVVALHFGYANPVTKEKNTTHRCLHGAQCPASRAEGSLRASAATWHSLMPASRSRAPRPTPPAQAASPSKRQSRGRPPSARPFSLQTCHSWFRGVSFARISQHNCHKCWKPPCASVSSQMACARYDGRM